MSKKVAVIMGFDSDLDIIRPCVQRLKSFSIPTEVHIIFAHRTPAVAKRFASQVRENGFGTIIATTSRTVRLADVLVIYTTLSVIGVPIKTSMMGGLDSLLSIVQMPKGIPVACVAVDGTDDAAILATQILALSDGALSDRLVQFKVGTVAEVGAKNHEIQMEESQYVL